VSTNIIYTTTKYSYKKEDNSCFLPGIFCHNATSEDQLLDYILMYLTKSDVKEAWMNENPKAEEIFYVTYKNEFEKNFYHGYRISVINLINGKTEVMNKDNNPSLWDKINKLVTETNV